MRKVVELLNILSFTYPHPTQIDRIAQILVLGTDAMKELSDRYVIIKNPNNDTMYDCPMHELPYKDIRNFGHGYPSQLYDQLTDSYSEEVLEQIFPKSDTNIRRKVVNTINFVIDKVYKTQTLFVRFSDSILNMESKQEIPNILYHVLQEEYKIEDMYCGAGQYNIIIQKKGAT